MPKKEFKYRGKTLEELQALSMEELARILPSRQRRKIRRGFREREIKLIRKLRDQDHVRTHLRGMIVLPEFVGKTIHIHKGNDFQATKIIPEMIGNYLGELALTRKRLQHNRPGVGATKSSASVSVR